MQLPTMKVSILIPCFNAAQWIGQAVESALAQSGADCEVIVVDDGSTDTSLDVIRSFGDRVRYETGPNRGGNAARNRLWQLASGEWLQYLDADDYLLPGKITNQMTCVEAHPAADVVYSPALLEEWTNDERPQALQASPLPEPHDPWIHLARWRLPQTGGSLWRKQAVLSAGRWDVHMPCCQEHELYLRTLLNGAAFVHCPDSGAVYRMWSKATVSRREPLKVARTRLQILQRMQDALTERGKLSPARLHAINLTRFETARGFWDAERGMAMQIMEAVGKCEPQFQPEGRAAGTLYRWLYRLLGFSATEHMAAWVRRTRRSLGHHNRNANA
jgi:glycosyltransferase involved in cell wall biosynthesis